MRSGFLNQERIGIKNGGGTLCHFFWREERRAGGFLKGLVNRPSSQVIIAETL